MPQSIRLILRNYPITLIAFAIIVFSMWIHGYITRQAILVKADEVKQLRLVLEENNKIHQRNAESFKRAISMYKAEVTQSAINYRLIGSSKESILTLLRDDRKLLLEILRQYSKDHGNVPHEPAEYSVPGPTEQPPSLRQTPAQ